MYILVCLSSVHVRVKTNSYAWIKISSQEVHTYIWTYNMLLYEQVYGMWVCIYINGTKQT